MFSRPTLVAASELLELHSQAAFNQMVVRLELERVISADTKISVQKKCALLARFVVSNSENLVETVEGCISLGKAVVHEAVTISSPDCSWKPQEIFERALWRDGFSLTWNVDGTAVLRPSLPTEFGSEPLDELRQLLKEYGFHTTQGHLHQALNAHVRGDFAAANAQIRTFLEALFDEISDLLISTEEVKKTSENRRKSLADIGFLSKDLKEWTDDGKNFINGLFKMLHTEGSHRGLSNVEHCTFRLHVVLVTARTFLLRLKNWN